MTQELLKKRQLVLIKYLKNLINGYSSDKWLVKAEYSTNDNDKRVVVVQEQDGQKTVFYGDILPLYNYYMVDIYGLTIQECKELSLLIGNLIGKSERIEVENKETNKLERWQIIFEQYVNPQAIEYMDIRRVGYNSTLQCIISKIYEKDL